MYIYIHAYIDTYIHTYTNTITIINNYLFFLYLTDRCCDNNQNCINTNGSYICECKTGYQLNVDLMTCSGMKST